MNATDLISRLEPIVKKWDAEADKLDEEVKTLEAVRKMVAPEAINPEMQWRTMQASTWRRCATRIKSEIDSFRIDVEMANIQKSRMEIELKLQGRTSEI